MFRGLGLGPGSEGAPVQLMPYKLCEGRKSRADTISTRDFGVLGSLCLGYMHSFFNMNTLACTLNPKSHPRRLTYL